MLPRFGSPGGSELYMGMGEGGKWVWGIEAAVAVATNRAGKLRVREVLDKDGLLHRRLGQLAGSACSWRRHVKKKEEERKTRCALASHPSSAASRRP